MADNAGDRHAITVQWQDRPGNHGGQARTLEIPAGSTVGLLLDLAIPDEARRAEVFAVAIRDGGEYAPGLVTSDGVKVADRQAPIRGDIAAEPVDKDHPYALEVLRHSAAHLMADAIAQVYPGTKFWVGPPVEDGFYYDVDCPHSLTEDDFKAIEKKMKEIAKKKAPFVRSAVDRDEALRVWSEKGDEYKVDLLERMPAGDEISFYDHGTFTDLCRGPHVPDTGWLQHVKLQKVAGAYWKGDASNKQLQRVYGTAFFTKEALADHLRLLEEAKLRDHRRLGREMDLFSFSEYAPAMPFLHPRGVAIWNAMLDWSRAEHKRRSYTEIVTPQLLSDELWVRSGHAEHYVQNMFFSENVDHSHDPEAQAAAHEAYLGGKREPWNVEQQLFVYERLEAHPLARQPGLLKWLRERFGGRVLPRELLVEAIEAFHEQDRDALAAGRFRLSRVQFQELRHHGFALKPMNCPGCMLYYNTRQHSYAEFPLRVAEFGKVHRQELSGVTHGLLRVQGFTQDDAHIFCTPEQLEDEILGCLDFVFHTYEVFGFTDIRLELSTRPEDFVGEVADWDRSEAVLQSALERIGREWKLNPGDGAFYGPKIDVHVRDALKRSWQLGTVQVDFNLPVRFDLEYVDRDNERKRPIMLHRAIFGSLERFFGILIEQWAGRFPVWLAPVQAKVLSIAERHAPYAEKLAAELVAAGVRAEADVSNERIGKKIRSAAPDKAPYLLIVGDEEVDNNLVSVRGRGNTPEEADHGQMPFADFKAKLLAEAAPPEKAAAIARA